VIKFAVVLLHDVLDMSDRLNIAGKILFVPPVALLAFLTLMVGMVVETLVVEGSVRMFRCLFLKKEKNDPI